MCTEVVIVKRIIKIIAAARDGVYLFVLVEKNQVIMFV